MPHFPIIQSSKAHHSNTLRSSVSNVGDFWSYIFYLTFALGRGRSRQWADHDTRKRLCFRIYWKLCALATDHGNKQITVHMTQVTDHRRDTSDHGHWYGCAYIYIVLWSIVWYPSIKCASFIVMIAYVMCHQANISQIHIFAKRFKWYISHISNVPCSWRGFYMFEPCVCTRVL